MVGGGDVGAPRRVVDRRARRARRDHVARRARLVLALVGEQRAVVDVADGVQPVDAVDQQGVVDVEPVAGLSPTVSSPRSPVRGARPVATSTSSARDASLPSSRLEHGVGRPSRCARPSTSTPVRTSTPRSRSASPTSSPANGSMPPSSPLRAMSVTSVPSARVGGRHLDADHAAAEDRERCRDLWALVASRLVHGLDVGEARDVGQQRARCRCRPRPRAGRSSSVIGAVVGGRR